MNWINFLQQIEERQLAPSHLPDDNKILLYLLKLDTSIYDFTSQQDMANLGKAFFYMVLVADFFSLPLCDTGQNIYEDVPYKFVNHDRIRTNYHGMVRIIGNSISNNDSLNTSVLKPHSLGLSRALVDCAYAYGWSPTRVMRGFLGE